MSLLTELGKYLGAGFYKDAAPTALDVGGSETQAEMGGREVGGMEISGNESRAV
jgi:hypothetical protein